MPNRLKIANALLSVVTLALANCSGQATPGTDGSAGVAGSGNTGGSPTSDSAGGTANSTAGTTAASSVGGSPTTTTGTTASGSGGVAPAARTCSSPAHVLPLNPADPQDGVTLGGFYVATDTWNAADYEVKQTLYICDYDNWYVVANMNDDARDGAVKTYPNVHKDFDSSPLISSFSTISSSFSHTGPRVGIYEFAYDIWLNGVASNGSTEVMIWTDNYNQVPSGSQVESIVFDGLTFRVYRTGHYIAFVVSSNVSSGTINLLSIFEHIIAKGWIPANSTLGQIDYGIELVSTGGADATFAVNGFSLTAN